MTWRLNSSLTPKGRIAYHLRAMRDICGRAILRPALTSMPPAPMQRWRFGTFECDAATGALWKSGRPVKLQDKPRQVLVALLERPGELVSRESLRHRLWTDDTFVDFDNGVNVCIRKLRDALGDIAAKVRYIETVRGHGYRFIAPVDAQLVPTPKTQPVKPAKPALAMGWWPVVATMLIVLGAAAFTAFRSTRADSAIQTLAVLPLANLLGDDQFDLQVDGLTEAVTAVLASRVQSGVIASRSTFPLRDTSDLRAISDRLHADALIVGSVGRTTAGFAIAVRLIEAESERVRWSGQFERSSLDDLAVADDIVAEILANVTGVTRSGSRTSARTPEVRADAHAAFLRGRFFWAKRGQANAVIASKYLSTAIQLQPNYAEAWAGLADVYAINSGAPSPVIVPWPGDSIDAGIYAAREALRLAPQLGEAHAALGKLYISQLRFADAEAELKEAVKLNPNYSTARQWLGTLYGRLRRCDEARTQVEIGARLDPLTALVNEAVGSIHTQCGEHTRAIEVLEAVLRMHPSSDTTRFQLGRALTGAGRAEEAVAMLAPLQRAGGESFVTSALMNSYGQAGQREKLTKLEASVKAPYLRAVAAAVRHDRARMYAELERAMTEGGKSWFTSLLVEAAFAPYLTEPEFAGIASRAGFPVPIRTAGFTPTTATTDR